MSVNIFHKTGSGTGTLQKVAGNTVILDASSSDIRTGTFAVTTSGKGATGTATITFDTPFPTNDDYIIAFEQDAPRVSIAIYEKTANGFKVVAEQFTENSGTTTITYTAARLIELDGYTELQNKVNNPDNTPTKDSENLIKSGGVFEALKGAGTVFTGTKAEWEALDSTDQERYEVVCITDDEESGIVDEYSTTETKTNKVWVDGKPIYRKVLVFNNPKWDWTPNTFTVPNIGLIVAANFIAYPDTVGAPNFYWTENWTLTDANAYLSATINSTRFLIKTVNTTTVTSDSKVIWTIEYTKTE